MIDFTIGLIVGIMVGYAIPNLRILHYYLSGKSHR